MKTINSLLITILILSLFIIGCEDFSNIEAPTLDQNTKALFASYVAIGNSLTSGTQNNSLYESGQRYSFPAILARQGGTEDFQQPLIQDPGIPGRMRIEKLDPFTIKTDPPKPTLLNANLPRPYNNLGIPGAILNDAVDETDFAAKAGPPWNNPFYSIVLQDQKLGKSVLQQAIAQEPTLITFWLGSSDILAYATSGGDRLLPTAANPGLFTAIYNFVADALAQHAEAAGTKIAIANIPDVSVLPFVNTIYPFILHPETGDTITFIGLSREDKVLLTAIDYINKGYGLSAVLGGNDQPLPGDVVLTVEEQEFVADRIGKFNQTIADVASQFDFALVDINTRLNQIHADNYLLGSDTLTTEYVTGGLFSLDGVHPTSIGNAIIANEFIKEINKKFGVNIPEVEVGTIPPSIEFVAKGMIEINDIKKIDAAIFNEVVNLYTPY